ncbi:MAG: Wobble nucleotide-excising tRNase [Bacteroidetes bacterium]|nr:Wobble nucleotide-excising tRNase [Bacteroidota bacterium]
MITKIKKIEGLGIFQDYQPDPKLAEFKTYNLFYGWNGSGKSTLGKLFRHMETHQPIEHNEKLTYKAIISGNQVDERSSISEPIRVFNSAFIKEHTDFEKSTTSSILYIGKEQVDLKNKIKESQEIYERDKAHVSETIIEEKKLEKKLEEFFITTGAELRDLHGTTVYSRATITKNTAKDLWEEVQKSGRTLDEIILSQDILANKIKFIEQGEEKHAQALITLKINDENLFQVQKHVQDLLQENPVHKAVARLAANPDIQAWVQQGLLLHNQHGSNKCEFCNNEISGIRKSELTEHFNDAFQVLQKNIHAAIQELEQMRIVIPQYQIQAFYEEFKIQINGGLALLEEDVQRINLHFDALIDRLKIKQKNPLETGFPAAFITLDLLPSWVQHFNSVVTEHNDAVKNFITKAAEYRKSIDLHVVAHNAKVSNLSALLNEYSNALGTIKVMTPLLKEAEAVIEALKIKLADDTTLIVEINNDLHKFLGRQEITLVKNPTGGYTLERHSKKATNLSEGEKSAISLVYFINKLKEKETKIQDLIVVFDDPMSSFDSNHLFAASSYIMNNCKVAKQLFILTHNFWFYKLIRDWCHKEFRKETEIYCLKKGKIVKADSTLIDHHSEYHFIFSRLLEWSVLEEVPLSDHFSLANHSRRLLESFNAFKTPSQSGFASILKLAQIKSIPKDVTDKLYYFLHKYSHLDRIEGHEHIVENIQGEGKQIALDTLSIINAIDPDHYASMITLCSGKAQ